MTKKFVIISGNIATGKTTLTRQLAKVLDWNFELESVADNPYLGDFYSDMVTWSLHLQFHFLGHRLSQHRRALKSERSVVLDRGIYEDADVFTAALHEAGKLSTRELATYRRIFDAISAELTPPDLILYLRAPTDVLLTRIRERSRSFEQNMSPAYLRSLERHYEKWIASVKWCPIVHVDTARTDLSDKFELQSVIARINASAPVR
jgi:deoxyadenosine/deoxycytidine kinase